MYHQCLLILVIVAQATLVFGGIPSYDNKNLNKTKIDLSCFPFSDSLILKHKIGPKTLSAIKDHLNINNSPIKSTHLRKVNRNQYGIINMLWSFPLKKLSSTSNYYSGHSLFKLPSRPKSIASTSNHIEFYYLDKTETPLKKNIQNNQQLNDEKALEFRGRYRRNMRKEARDYPILAFLINDPNYKRLPRQSNDLMISKSQTPSLALLNHLNLQNFNYSTLLNTIKYEDMTANRIVVDNERPAPAMNTVVTVKRGKLEEYPITLNTLTSTGPKLTTVYDKIKFFEMYDNNTPFPNNVDTRKVINMKNVSSNNNVHNDRRIMLENVDESLQHKNSSTEKTKVKEIYFKRNRKDLNSEKSGRYPARFFDVLSTKKNNVTNRPLIVTKLDTDNKNITVPWSDYSFMAAYIYESKQILCDAAAISPHWLVTSGSCLSKRHMDPGGEGRSAYVAYCNSSWWNAERLAYVKYSVVHPRYNENYTRRRIMYNMGKRDPYVRFPPTDAVNEQARACSRLRPPDGYNLLEPERILASARTSASMLSATTSVLGLIQVVISMATCTSWAPVALISHKFMIPPAGSKAYAVGWGLERYKTGYRAAKSARNPLMVYESKLFQNSCLNKFTSSIRNNNVEEDLQNLYCLSSPTYSGEANAPVYGSMLLIEGKLCGIYLQEQQQSAQYSSIWRLGPWVSKVAREPVDS